MKTLLQGLAAIIIMISSWIPTVVVTLIALAMVDNTWFIKIVVAVIVYNVWHWGGYFIGMFLLAMAGED